MNLENLKNRSILLLGKTRALTREEFDKLLEIYAVTCKERYDADVALVIEGRMMNPYEQNLAERLYEEHRAAFDTIENLERQLCNGVDPDRLMMSLKLSGDQERLRSFLKNPYIDNAFFLRLLQLYKWGGEGFFATDENRDVTASLIERFYENIERNHNVQYANTGLIHLLLQSRDALLIETLCRLEPIQNAMKQGCEGAMCKIIELLSRHEATPESQLRQMVRLGDDTLRCAVASRAQLEGALQRELLTCKAPEVLQALAQRSDLEPDIAEALLEMPDYAATVMAHAALDTERFESFMARDALAVAANPSLDASMLRKLLERESPDIDAVLAANSAIDGDTMAALFGRGDPAVLECLAANTTTPPAMLEQLFETAALHTVLAGNPNTPLPVLQRLSQEHDMETLRALAANPATPIEILFQLQLDARLKRTVSENPAFGEHIQTSNIGWL